MNKIVIALVLWLQVNIAWAISNIENERPNLPEQGLSGSLAVGLNGKTGNQEEQSDEAAAKLIWRVDDDIFMALIERKYGTKHNVKDTDNSFLHTRWIHLLNERWALEGFAQWEKDEFDNLTSRTLEGGGGRYQIAQKKDVYSFAVGLGGFHEVEKENLVDHEETYRLWRLNSYYSYKYQLNEQVSFVNTAYYQPSTSEWSNYRVLSETGLNIKLIANLELSINYKFTYNSRPAQNVNVIPVIDNFRTNTEYKTSIAYHF